MAPDIPRPEAASHRLPDLISIGLLTRYFDRDLVAAVVAAADVREQRSRLLPAWIVVYYCLAMTVFFPAGSIEVWDRLVSGLQWAGALDHRPRTPSKEAISRARQRLGWKAMAALLARVAGPVASPADTRAFVAGLRTVAFDTTTVEVPHTAKNIAGYGTPPRMLAVAAGENGTGAVIGVATGSPAEGSSRLARGLLNHLDAGTLAVFGPEFHDPALPARVRATGAHLLVEARTATGLPVLRALEDGSYLSRPSGPGATDDLVRVIECRAPAGSFLVTDVLDPARLTCAQANSAVRARWRLTTCLDVLRLSGRDGEGMVSRSKSPEMVRQELYSALCVYQAIRGLTGALS